MLPYVEFDPQRCAEQVRILNPAVDILSLSATRGNGIGEWYRWLRGRAGAGRAADSLQVDSRT